MEAPLTGHAVERKRYAGTRDVAGLLYGVGHLGRVDAAPLGNSIEYPLVGLMEDEMVDIGKRNA